MLMFKLHPRFPGTVRLSPALPLLPQALPGARACPDRAAKALPSLDRASALAMVDAGYMPLQRYVELFDESMVTPPYNAGNFGEGEA